MPNREFGDTRDIAPGEHTTGWILRRIENQDAGARGDLAGQLVDVEAELTLLAQGDRDRGGTDKVDHRLVNRKAGVGIDDFVSRLGQSEQNKEHDRLAPRRD